MDERTFQTANHVLRLQTSGLNELFLFRKTCKLKSFFEKLQLHLYYYKYTQANTNTTICNVKKQLNTNKILKKDLTVSLIELVTNTTTNYTDTHTNTGIYKKRSFLYKLKVITHY